MLSADPTRAAGEPEAVVAIVCASSCPSITGGNEGRWWCPRPLAPPPDWLLPPPATPQPACEGTNVAAIDWGVRRPVWEPAQLLTPPRLLPRE